MSQKTSRYATLDDDTQVPTFAQVNQTGSIVNPATPASTIADGADVTQGAIADAAATAGSTGTISAKLRTISASLGAVADAAWASGSGSIVAILKGIFGKIPVLGQAAAAASLPVVQALDVFTSPVNVAVSVANTTTELIAAAGATIRKRRTLLKNTGDRAVYLGFGASAATTMFLLGVGESLPVDDLRAINGITASGTGTVFVLASARS